MKRVLFFLMFILSLLQAVVCIPADGQQISQDRDYHYYLHNNSNDYNFYGANRWAVKFDFSQSYPGMSNVSFNVNGARLWFPNPVDQVSVELCTDANSQPGSVVSSQNAVLTDNLMDIYFPQASTHEIAWLVVTYNTNMQSRYVAASAGGGEHSYFMNQVGDQLYLSSFAEAGFNCELLFGLLGDFTHTEADLELVDFELEGDLLPGTRAYPKFRVYNHSNQTVGAAGLSIMLNKPGEPRFDSLYVSVAQSIPPYSEYYHSSDNQFVELPSDPIQMRVDLLLESEYAENDTLAQNNSLSRVFNVFEDPMPGMIVENFLRASSAEAIGTVQMPHLNRDIHVLDYYPLLSVPLSNLGSMQRFNWYGFNALPQTIGNGHSRIIGITQGYDGYFSELLENIVADNTFITESSCRLDTIPNSENLILSIGMRNQRTAIYASNQENISLDSRFFVGLFGKASEVQEQKYGLLRWISFADTINTIMLPEVNVEKNYNVSLSTLFDDMADMDYRIYYWLQDKNGARIHYMNYDDIFPQQYTSNEDEMAPHLDLSFYPNPLRGNESLRLKLKDGAEAKIRIYNLRGQLIHAEKGIKGTLKLNNELFPASGVYLIRVEQNGRATNKKISIIK